MDISTFMVIVFWLIDEWLADKQLRRRGPQPTLHNSEVLTIEVIGEFLGMDEDKAIYTYFRRHWANWFPDIAQAHRTTFVRQVANLWAVKQQLWEPDRLRSNPLDCGQLPCPTVSLCSCLALQIDTRDPCL